VDGETLEGLDEFLKFRACWPDLGRTLQVLSSFWRPRSPDFPELYSTPSECVRFRSRGDGRFALRYPYRSCNAEFLVCVFQSLVL
jgi:hypothetical protein